MGRAVSARRPDRAAAALARWRDCGEVVIEITDHRTRGSQHQAARMLRLAEQAGLPAVLSNAVRYAAPADAAVAQVLDAARQLAPLGERHLARRNAQAYLASGAEMARIAARLPGRGHRAVAEARLLRATAALADALHPGPRAGPGHRRPVHAGDHGRPAPLRMLRARCTEGLRRRYPGGPRGQRTARRRAARRLDHELAIISKTGLAVLLPDRRGRHGLIRGRGHPLLDPRLWGGLPGQLPDRYLWHRPGEYDLLMERFLSESRPGLPDIDLDVESARRIEAYRAIVDAYSEQRIACVSMMETYRARSAIRDVAASLGLPPARDRHGRQGIPAHPGAPHPQRPRRTARTARPAAWPSRSSPGCSGSPSGSTGCPGMSRCIPAAWCCRMPPCWTGPRWSAASKGCR